jgi:hypothetical protein
VAEADSDIDVDDTTASTIAIVYMKMYNASTYSV